jgi:carboxyl-terminal processing protease
MTMKTTDRYVLAFLVISFVVLSCFAPRASAQEPTQGDNSNWTGTTEQKVWGLMTIWAETKYAYPHFDKRPELDWDATVQQYLPRVIATETMDEYYLVLQELVALLQDSHTRITPPWGHFKPGNDLPPIEVNVLDGRFIITRVGDNEEIKSQNIRPGLEILEVGEGIPVRDYFENNVLKYNTQGSQQGNEAILPVYLLFGPQDEKVNLLVREIDGSDRAVTLTRNAMTGGGPPFMYLFVQKLFAETIDARMLEGDVLYVSIPNFENTRIEDDFRALIDTTDSDAIKGMIIDVRSNMGGKSTVSNGIVSCLIEGMVSSPLMRYPVYSAAREAWGRDLEWSIDHTTVAPRDGKTYIGPLVLLVDGGTNSSAEDIVIELQQTGRTTVVGTQTCGGAGHGLVSALPGGGTFSVSTFDALFPDRRDFAGIGIKPDVIVAPSREDVYRGRDIVLEKGLSVLLNGETNRN